MSPAAEAGSQCQLRLDEPALVDRKVQKVAGTVYMLQGAGGNIGASVGEDGIVIVDDEFAPWRTKSGRPLRALPTRLTRTCFNRAGSPMTYWGISEATWPTMATFFSRARSENICSTSSMI